MSLMSNRHFSIALKELRTAVTLCCWLVGLSLLAQVVVWSLLTFSDIRYRVVEAAPSPNHQSEVLSPTDVRRQALREPKTTAEEPAGVVAVDVNRQYAGADTVLRVTTGVSTAVGTMAAAALLPLLAVAVVLAAGAATPGVNLASGSFVWAVILVVLLLPLGRMFDDMPFEGLFMSFSRLSEDVEAARGRGLPHYNTATDGGVLFYGRYCVLPLLCVAGVAATGLRFRAGVEAGVLPAEDYRLDPELEKEVSKIKTGSLIGGGRVAGALQNTLKPGQPEMKTASLRQISAGEAEVRPI